MDLLQTQTLEKIIRVCHNVHQEVGYGYPIYRARSGCFRTRSYNR